MWVSIIISAVCTILAYQIGTRIGGTLERNSWLIRAGTQDNKCTTAHHYDGEFYYVIEERYFNNNYSMKTKTSQEQKDERCEEELKGWVDK